MRATERTLLAQKEARPHPSLPYHSSVSKQPVLVSAAVRMAGLTGAWHALPLPWWGNMLGPWRARASAGTLQRGVLGAGVIAMLYNVVHYRMIQARAAPLLDP